MKVFIYLEFESLLKGSGIYNSFKNQQRILINEGICTLKKEDSDILHFHYPGPKSVYWAKKYKKLEKKIIFQSHVTAEDFRNSFRFSNTISEVFLKRYLPYVYSLADMIIAPSDYTKNILMRYGLDGSKIIVLSNGVNLEKFKTFSLGRDDCRKKYSLNGFVVFSVGGVLPVRKGVDSFLAVAKRFPNNDFVWFGKILSGLFVPAVINNEKNVRFTGYVDDINSAYNAGDIFLFPSREENQGMVILEAAAAGKPIIIRDIPAYEGWLIDRKNCLKAKNDEEFAECVNMLLNNSDLREKLGKESLSLAADHNLIRIKDNLAGIYDKLLLPKI